MERITSKSNALISHIRKLAKDRKYRRQSGEFLCEGPKMLDEAIRWGADIRTVLFVQEEKLPAGIPETARVVQIPEELLKSAAPTETPQNVLFVCGIPDGSAEGKTPERILVLDGLQDPGNVGTLWRTADAMGADRLYLLPGCADPWNPKTLRATMGACFRFTVSEGTPDSLDALLKENGIPLYATALREDTEDIRHISLKKAAVVIGSEGKGISEEMLRRSTKTLKIPMTERCESLNAAVAGTIVLWQMCQDTLA